jgi:ATP-binding cassette subfamily C protein
MLGMLRPQQGGVYIDDALLTEKNLSAWQHTVGYVPQHIYLTDNTIARNIAFGVPDSDLDYEAIEEATRRAQIYDFIMNELPHGLESVVGERGVKLSGGQQQRLGIARALYHRPSVIFFDEATSALDRETEEEVMQAVYALGETRTVILISHRLSTVERADRVFKLHSGQLVREGSYKSVIS